jgi:hypothetical protein
VEGLPSSRRHPRYVPLPHTPGSPSRLRFQALHRFRGLHLISEGSAFPVPPEDGTSNDAAGLRHATDRIAAPLQGF